MGTKIAEEMGCEGFAWLVRHGMKPSGSETVHEVTETSRRRRIENNFGILAMFLGLFMRRYFIRGHF